MAAAGEVSWPPAGSILAAYGEILTAADTRERLEETQPRSFLLDEVVPRFVDLEVAVPHLSPAVW
jgi:hypothetical protein